MKTFIDGNYPVYAFDGTTAIDYVASAPLRCSLMLDDSTISLEERDDLIMFGLDISDPDAPSSALRIDFNLLDVLENLMDCSENSDGTYEIETQPKFVTLRQELLDMIAKIDTMKFG